MNNDNFELKKIYLKLDIQYFANDEGGEKTEEPTAKKQSEARKEGQVAKSVEISTAFLFIGMFYGLKMFAKYMYGNISDVMNFSFSLLPIINEGIVQEDYIHKLIVYIFGNILITVAPIFLISMTIGIITNLVQVGWHPTSKPLQPKFSKLNPISGFKRLFSFKSLFELLKSIIKLTIISVVIYGIIKDELNRIQTLLDMEILQAAIYIGNLIVDIGLAVGMYFIFIAAADFAYQKFHHHKDLKMTKQEVKEEYKNAEGNPEIKSKIKQKMREASMRRMMNDVPKADVIITNPTHYAVALKYDREKSSAPIVVAKGEDHLAKKIKEVAKQNNIEIVENKYLARTIYATVDIGKEIPPELYQAVAEVLAFVYNLKNSN